MDEDDEEAAEADDDVDEAGEFTRIGSSQKKPLGVWTCHDYYHIEFLQDEIYQTTKT